MDGLYSLQEAPGVHAQDKWTALPRTERWLTPSNRDVAFIFSEDHANLFPAVRARYPDGELHKRRAFSGERLGLVYLVFRRLRQEPKIVSDYERRGTAFRNP